MKNLKTILSLALFITSHETLFSHSLSADAAKTERPGPSNRRSPFIISEIMYHPSVQSDGANLEFIEVFNSQPWLEEIGEYSLNGDIQFTFPANTTIEKLSHIVIAANPEAIKKKYGLENVLGPYAGSLSNKGGRLKLLNNLKAVLFEVNYETRSPWPRSADGAGHSLKLNRPSYGENDERAWTQSNTIGGSPGRADKQSDEPLICVNINEIKTNAKVNGPAFIELYNHSKSEIDLSGAILTDSISEKKYTFSDGSKMAARSWLAIKESNLGFKFSEGNGVVWFFNADGIRILDALHYNPQPDGFSLGCSIDGDSLLDHFAKPTLGTANRYPFQHTVVINEIMYNPISLDDEDEYVELHNHGNESVDISDWKFSDGIEFVFPPSTQLLSGGYIIVAKNRDKLLSKYKGIDAKLVFGNFSGTLSNSGERLLLTKPKPTLNSDQVSDTRPIQIPVDEVTYKDSEAWGQWSDAGGSSLELRNPKSDNRQPSNWNDSDETDKSQWVSIFGEGEKDKSRYQSFSSNYLQMYLLDKGECLIDEVQVFDAKTEAKRIKDPGFEKPITTQNFGLEKRDSIEISGTHKQSKIVENRGIKGTRALHVKAVNRGDTEGNSIWMFLSGRNPTTMRIEAKARWMRGHPEILLRTRSGAFEAFGNLTVPDNLGTPTKKNSSYSENTEPTITDVIHSPVFPKKRESAIVTARITDPDGISNVSLFYRIDPSKTITEVEMLDDGSLNDEVAKDGIFSGQIPAQTSSKLVCFWIEANDAIDQNQPSKYPLNAPSHECLVRMGANQPKDNSLGQYHFLINRNNSTEWSKNHKRSNAPLPVTMVYNSERVIYDAGLYYGAGSYHSRVYTGPTGPLSDYNAIFQSDNRFLGSKKIVMSMPGQPSNRVPEATAQLEQAAYWLMYKAGIPSMHRRFVNLYINGRKRGKVYEDTQRPNGEIIRQWYPNNDGEMHKIQMWKEMTNPKRSQDYDYQSHPAELGGKQDADGIQRWYYRLTWAPRAYKGSANKMDSLLELVKRINDTKNPQYIQRLEEIANMDQWMRVFALQNIVCNWDSYGSSNGQNMSTFKPSNGQFEMIPWDLDLGFGQGSFSTSNKLFATNNPFFPTLTGDPIIKKIYRLNHFKRYYLRAVLEMLDGPMSGDLFKEYVDKKYEALRANNQTVSKPNSLSSFIKGRELYLRKTINRLDDEFTTDEEVKVETDKLFITLNGTAPLRMKTLQVNGIPQKPEWKRLTTWQIQLPIEAALKTYTIKAIDNSGQPIDEATKSIEVKYTGTKSFDHEIIQINEWMASNNNILKDEADGDFDDWIELHNTSQNSVSLTGWVLTDDKESPDKWFFPEGASIPSGGYIVVWADNEPQQTGTEFHLPFKLSAKGESIVLFDPDGRLADEVNFSQQKPNVSSGLPENTGEPSILRRATPGAKNDSGGISNPSRIIKLLIGLGKPLTIKFYGEKEIRYIIEYSTDLRTWIEEKTVLGKNEVIQQPVSLNRDQPETFFRIRTLD